MSEVNYKVESNICWIGLNRPDASNAFSDQMIVELCNSLREADQDDDVRVIVIYGEGKSFCAGGDVKAMKNKSGMFAGESEHLRQLYRNGIQNIPKTMEAIQKPTIAMVNGAAIGAGCDFSCMADIRIASDKAKFGETFVKLGLVPGDGGTYFLSRVVGYSKACEMFFTGQILNAQEALSIGLVSRVVEHEQLKEETLKVANMIASNAPIALRMTKKALKDAQRAQLENHLELLASFQGITQRTSDHFEGVNALLEKRKANFSGQ